MLINYRLTLGDWKFKVNKYKHFCTNNIKMKLIKTKTNIVI